MKIPDMSKFHFPEIFNDSKGKTSPSLVCGVFTCVTALCGIICAGNTIVLMVVFKYEKDPNVIMFLQTLVLQCVVVLGIGVSLLGINRLSKDKPLTNEI
jgi:hypothetical protein